MTWRAWFNGVRALWRSVRVERVTQVRAANRATHCANCTWLVRNGGLPTRLVSWAYEQLIPAHGHGEPWLSRQPWKCGLCQCSLRVKLRLSLASILAYTTIELYDRLPQSTCWIRLEALSGVAANRNSK